ncbi:hypothetical protein G6F56_012039 [Rhizopus delemar]|nr:hypothetical protein G6F56_012039 [Rhizopus delemar]
MNKATRNNSRSNSSSSTTTNESKSHQRRSFFGFGSTTQEEKKPKAEDRSSQSTTTSTEREKLRQQYQGYDSRILDQRKNRPQLKLEDFKLARTLGTGSFGRVHLSQSKHNNRYYAIKVLKKTEVVRLKQVEHTNNEKNILETTANPFMVNLWGTFQDDINLYMVMDYVPGGELFNF